MLNLFCKIHNFQKSAFKLFSFVLFLFLLNQSFAQLFAKENWKEFLEALENRQYYEEALDYLDSISNDPNTDSQILTELPDRIAKIKQKVSNKSKESVQSPNLSYKNINALSDSTIPNETLNLESSQSDLTSLKNLDQINSFYEAVEQCNILFAALVKLNNEKDSNLSEESNSKKNEQKKNLALQLDQAIRLALTLSERPETLEAERKNNNKTVLRDSSNKSLEMQILNLRFQWAYLSLILERNEDAMILGTYIARNNADFSNVISAAEIAMQSCKNLYTEFQNDPDFSSEDRTQSFLFINDKIAEFTDFILSNWNSAQSPEKQEFIQKILLFRINIAISSNNIEIAQQFLQQLSDSSDLKAIGELRFGLALWIKWLENAQKQENDQNLSNEFENENAVTDIEKQSELLNQAKTFLDSGLHRKIELNNGFDRVDYLSSYSALILANILFLQNDFDAAWQWLNHPQIGPNTLTQESILASKGIASAQNNDSTGESNDSEANKTVVLPDFLDESFQTKTLILALRLYINGQQFDKAEETINDLESFYTSNKSELVLVYIQIGKQLEDQIRQLSQSSSKDQLTEITTTFELFLDRLSNKSDENDYMTLRWIGDTYMSFGKGLFGSLTEPSEEAQNYFIKAGRIYQKIRKKIQGDPHWAGIDNAETATVLRLSQCLCAIGRQEKALPLLIELLEQSESILELQIEAANVYQSMGRNNKENYIRAIVGEYKKENGQNLVWGWNGIIYRISRKINDQSQLTDYFYEAITNKMSCRYSYIRALNDKNEIAKQAKNAEKELLRFQQTYPDLGGINWKKKLEAQLKQFRRLQGQINPQGF
ncbi:MAG: hypothetical protein Q4C95_12240 [Planctomycetia bacterium]|nr:hypothetical protein [Planctomycetia bacterium]